VNVEVLYFDGCPGYEALLPRLRELLREAGTDATVELRLVETPQVAEAARFLGSPSLRINGRDVEPGADTRTDFGMKCRLYHAPDGLCGTPPDGWIRDAIDRAARDRSPR